MAIPFLICASVIAWVAMKKSVVMMIVVRLWHFIEALTWTAVSALTGIRLRHPDNVACDTVDGVYIHSWSLKHPNRMASLAEGRIEMRYVSGLTSTKRLQQVIKARIMTPTVAAMLARVEEGVWHEPA